MKRKFSSLIIGASAVGAVLSMGHAGSASADDYSRESGFQDDWQARRHDGHRQFALGVCVGQALEQQGVSVPVPQPGQAPSLDSTTQAALQSAAQACREQMDGNPAPQPSPTPSNSPAPPTGTGGGGGTSTGVSVPNPTSSAAPAGLIPQ